MLVNIFNHVNILKESMQSIQPSNQAQAVLTLSTGMDWSWNTPLSPSEKNQDLLWLKQYIYLKDSFWFLDICSSCSN